MPVNGSLRLLVLFLVSPDMELLSGFDCSILIRNYSNIFIKVNYCLGLFAALQRSGGVGGRRPRRSGRGHREPLGREQHSRCFGVGHTAHVARVRSVRWLAVC